MYSLTSRSACTIIKRVMAQHESYLHGIKIINMIEALTIIGVLILGCLASALLGFIGIAAVIYSVHKPIKCK